LDTVLEFHTKAPQASEGLAQGRYVVARVEFEPETFLTKGVRIYK